MKNITLTTIIFLITLLIFIYIIYLSFSYKKTTCKDKLKQSIMKGFWSEDQEKNKIFSITFGPEGTKMIHAMHDAMIAYANNGVNSVADYITYEPWWIPELKEKCGQHNIPLYLIKIDASLEEIQKRELERGSFPACQARSHYNTVRNRINYFLEIDNETH